MDQRLSLFIKKKKKQNYTLPLQLRTSQKSKEKGADLCLPWAVLGRMRNNYLINMRFSFGEMKMFWDCRDVLVHKRIKCPWIGHFKMIMCVFPINLLKSLLFVQHVPFIISAHLCLKEKQSSLRDDCGIWL